VLVVHDRRATGAFGKLLHAIENVGKFQRLLFEDAAAGSHFLDHVQV
jgi:hypothetical protein